MGEAPFRPRLRAVEIVVVADPAHGRALMLRDTEGIAPNAIVMSAALSSILRRFDGAHTIEQIAERERGVSVARVRQIAAELDEALFLDTPRFRARERHLIGAFRQSAVRAAAHAGGAYHDDPRKLARFIDESCIAKAPERRRPGSLRAICAPHMDLWRAAVGYGHAYRAVLDGLAPEVDTFVLLGTSHAAMERPFAVCRKTFETPLGSLAPHDDAIHALTKKSRFDVHADEYLHKTEHSLEFQTVFLKHALGKRKARIVPVLCGLGASQARRRDPARDADAESFVQALAEVVADLDGRAVIVAGADLAHVGPRFGDAGPLDLPGRKGLEVADRASIGLAIDRDAPSFFAQVASDLATRRVCGLAPIYTMLRVMNESLSGELLHYEQCVDPEEGSIVSHASIAYWQA